MKKKKRLSSTAALTIGIAALTLALWAAAMALVTYLCAWDVFGQFKSQFFRNLILDGTDVWNEPVNDRDPYNGSEVDDTLYAYTRYGHSIHLPEDGEHHFHASPYYNYSIIWVDYTDTDGDGFAAEPQVRLDDGNYLYFDYDLYTGEYSEEFGREFEFGVAYIDLDETAYGRQLIRRFEAEGASDRRFYDGIDREMDRLVGYFEGDKFHLLEVADYPADIIEYYGATIQDNHSNPDWYNALISTDPEPEWVTTVAEAPEGQETVVLYTDGFNVHLQNTDPVTLNGVTYDCLEDVLLLDSQWYYSNITIKKDLKESVFLFWGDDLIVGMQCHPLELTLKCLMPLYIGSFVILLLIWLLVWLWLRRRLGKPMNALLAAGEGDFSDLQRPKGRRWADIDRLEQWYTDAQQAHHGLKIENKQLTTALDFVRNAEENRKQMISNIAHELKTPLAVIHSYAEGLDQGIAVNKQAQYLEIILEETEQMDAMVLEMLDLSRLEAGRIRLQSDRFSIAKLTRHIFETLAPMAEEKELKIHFGMMEDFQTTADEGRIGQVIRNFATNAIKYTPEGGEIWVNVFYHKNQVNFSIENQCKPFTPEVLEKIWESFYRADPSRNAKGTGLGLPIAKSIIELHQGTVSAENTQTGVIFRFTLP